MVGINTRKTFLKVYFHCGALNNQNEGNLPPNYLENLEKKTL